MYLLFIKVIINQYSDTGNRGYRNVMTNCIQYLYGSLKYQFVSRRGQQCM